MPKESPKKLKKLLIIDQDVAALGGAEFLLTNLVSEFKNLGINVWFITNHEPFRKSIQRNCEKTYFAPSRMNVFGGTKGLVKFFVQLPFALIWYCFLLMKYKKSSGRIVLITGFSDKIAVSPLAHLLKLKVIWLEHSSLTSVFKRNFGIPGVLYKYSLKYPDLIITPSNYTKQMLINELGKDDKFTVIHNGINILSNKDRELIFRRRKSIRNKYDVPQEAFVLGVMSRLEPEKGQDTLIKALGYLKTKIKNVYLIIAGEGDDLNRLKKIAEEIGVSKKVNFLGFIPEVDKYEVISIFDIYVFPTRWPLEGFGIAPLEAMVLGIPVIASISGPVTEVVGNSGILIKPSEFEIAKTVIALFNDKKKMNSVSNLGLDRITKFDIKDTAKAYLSEFRKISYYVS